VEFSLGARHKLEEDAVHLDVTALHLSIVHGTMQPSVSTQIAALRQGLFAAHAHEGHGEASARFADVVRVRGLRVPGRVCHSPSHLAVQGRIPLVIKTHSVDVIATLIQLKKEFEARTGHPLRMTVVGATEAYLLASKLAEAGVGVL
jgi:hypothetical protein